MQLGDVISGLAHERRPRRAADRARRRRWSPPICDRVVVLDFGHMIAERSPGRGTSRRARDRRVPRRPRRRARRRVAGGEPRRDRRCSRCARLSRRLRRPAGRLRPRSRRSTPARSSRCSARTGRGRRTTILAIAGVLPSRGEVIFDGVRRGPVRTAAPGAASRVIPEGRSVFMGLSAEKNLQLGQARSTPHSNSSPSCDRCSPARPGCSRAASSRSWPRAARLAASPRLLLVDELSLGLAPMVVRRLLDALRAAAARRRRRAPRRAARPPGARDRRPRVRHVPRPLRAHRHRCRAQLADRRHRTRATSTAPRHHDVGAMTSRAMTSTATRNCFLVTDVLEVRRPLVLGDGVVGPVAAGDRRVDVAEHAAVALVAGMVHTCTIHWVFSIRPPPTASHCAAVTAVSARAARRGRRCPGGCRRCRGSASGRSDRRSPRVPPRSSSST